jgi:hypothetical protein
MMIRLFVALILALLLLQLSCKKSPTEPEFKSPREYTWTAVFFPYAAGANTEIRTIWGTSSTNLYAAGLSRSGGLEGAVYHFDSWQWQSVPLPRHEYNNFSKIIGFNSNDIWAAGAYVYPNNLDSALLLRYDGSGWRSMLPSHFGLQGLTALWGSSPRDIYCGSRNGRMLRWNGVNWNVDTLGNDTRVNSIGGSSDNLFAFTGTYVGISSDTLKCFRKTADSWSLLDWQISAQQVINPKFGERGFYTSPEGTHYCCTWGAVFRWSGTVWEKIFESGDRIYDVKGTGNNNIIVVGWNEGALAYHWNGIDWKKINLQLNIFSRNVQLFSVWITNEEEYVVGNDFSESYVLHGK